MTGLNDKRRTAYAKEAAKSRFKEMGYSIINSDNHIFCFIATRAGIYERKIRVIIDEIKDEDIDLIKKTKIIPSQTKEIWCHPYKSREWKTLGFDHKNNPVNS
jgi:hypothetical protein